MNTYPCAELGAKINDIHDFTGYCYFHDKTELGGCFLHSVLLALSLGPD